MNEYAKNLEILYQTPEEVPEAFTPDPGTKARQVIQDALDKGITQLGREAMTEILDAYEIPVTRVIHAATTEEALAAAEQLGYPVAVKIDSPDSFHKTDVGRVVLDIHHPDSLRVTFSIGSCRMPARPDRTRLRLGVDRRTNMADKRCELLTIVYDDPVFGRPGLNRGWSEVMSRPGSRGVRCLPQMCAMAAPVQGADLPIGLLEGYRNAGGGLIRHGSAPVWSGLPTQSLDFPEIRGPQPRIAVGEAIGGMVWMPA